MVWVGWFLIKELFSSVPDITMNAVPGWAYRKNVLRTNLRFDYEIPILGQFDK